MLACLAVSPFLFLLVSLFLIQPSLVSPSMISPLFNFSTPSSTPAPNQLDFFDPSHIALNCSCFFFGSQSVQPPRPFFSFFIAFLFPLFMFPAQKRAKLTQARGESRSRHAASSKRNGAGNGKQSASRARTKRRSRNAGGPSSTIREDQHVPGADSDSDSDSDKVLVVDGTSGSERESEVEDGTGTALSQAGSNNLSELGFAVDDMQLVPPSHLLPAPTQARHPRG